MIIVTHLSYGSILSELLSCGAFPELVTLSGLMLPMMYSSTRVCWSPQWSQGLAE